MINEYTVKMHKYIISGELWGWVDIVKVLRKRNLIDTDNSTVITRGKGGWWEIEESLGVGG